jgi:hypothetical protein
MRRIIMSGAAAALLAVLLAPAPAGANDRDLKATHISVYECQQAGVSSPDFRPAYTLSEGILFNGTPAGVGQRAVSLYCPLPLNNVDLGGTTNDNDISSYTVFYQDADGLGERVQMVASLWEQTLTGGKLVSRYLCGWNSNSDTTGSTAFTSDNVPCAVDLQATSFYVFEVNIWVNEGGPLTQTEAAFAGIRFP